jgi:carboxyl-terminal processing protease
MKRLASARRWLVCVAAIMLLLGHGAQCSLAQKASDSHPDKAISAEERVAGFVRLWSEVKCNFAFFERVPEVNWDKVLDEYLPKVLKEQTTEEYYRLLEHCVAQLKDGHTTVYPPHNRNVGPLPVRLKIIDGKAIIVEVAPAAAAAEPRLKPGLELTHIDGRTVAEILTRDVYPYIADSTPQNRDRWAARRLIVGPTTSQAQVGLRNAGGETLDLALTRGLWTYPRAANFEYCDLGEGMAYVALNSFESDEPATLFKARLDDIRRHRGLIIDVRNNGGGSSRVGYAVLSCLIDKPARGSRWKTRQYLPTFRAWGQKEGWHEGGPSVIKPTTEKPFLSPVVVLIGPDTVSAAEDFVVAIHAADRATLVGEKTAGTTGMPLTIDLPRHGKARICTKSDCYPDGREFVGIGVIPDVRLQPTRESLAAGKDVVLEGGIQTLAKQIGNSGLDAVKLAARLNASRGQTPTKKNGRDLTTVYREAQTEYDALAAAYAKKDWKAVNAHAHSLSRLFRRESLAETNIESIRRAMKAAGIPETQIESDLAKLQTRKKEVEAFFKVEPGSKEIHRLNGAIEDLSDEIHDCVRDGKIDRIERNYLRLEKVWKTLKERLSSSGHAAGSTQDRSP